MINAVVKPEKVARAFAELRCNFGAPQSGSLGDRSIIPDISVFQWSRIPCKENGGVANIFNLAPDWTIEILSPDQSQTRVTKNILHCLQHGTQMGWLIDPEDQSVFVYSPDQPTTVYDRPKMHLPVPEFAQDLRLNIEDLFNWLME